MSKLTPEDKLRIKQKWGVLTVPKGETKRAKEIRKDALNFQNYQVKLITKSLKTWLKAHPDATEKQVKLRREENELALERILNTKTKNARIARKKWDWREHKIDVGPVMNQGLQCNTCWAFAATSAAHANLQKNYIDYENEWSYTVTDDGVLIGLIGTAVFLVGDPSPFVQDLLNCMPIPQEELCRSGWHGKAFDFMVYGKGIPLGFADGFTDTDPDGKTITYRREYVRGKKFECNPTWAFLQANAWDYVNSPPDELPTVEQLKTALIEHGPLVAPIFYDDNLQDYKGGIFDGENMGMINHVVLLFGWDDKQEAWLIKNSWGEEWGEKGFGWIKYGSNNIGMFAAWIEADMNSMKAGC
jgi:Papain family cysteine protease